MDVSLSDQEVISPPFERPGIEQIPDQHHDERAEETVDHAVAEIAPGDHLVPETVFGRDPDQFVVEIPPGPAAGDLPFAVERIFPAVEHPFQVERLLHGQTGQADIEDQRHDHGDEIPFITVDWTFDSIHFPDNDWMEWM